RLDREQVGCRFRVSKIEVVELHCDHAIEAPACEDPRSVAVLVEIEIDVVEIVYLGREIAESRAEIEAGVFVRKRRNACQRSAKRHDYPDAFHARSLFLKARPSSK